MSSTKRLQAEVLRLTPLDSALHGLIELADRRAADTLRPEAIRLRRSSSPVGDLVLDLREISGIGQDPSPASRLLAEQIERLPGVSRAIAIPPRIHLTLDARWMGDRVTAAIGERATSYGTGCEGAGRDVVLSFSNPNANKPLHAGHLRDNFLGMALQHLFHASGCAAVRSSTVSDWGVHICHAAVAYQLWGEGATPASERVKSDWFVGDLLARFHRSNSEQEDERVSEFQWGPTPLEEAAAVLLKKAAAGDQEALESISRISSWALSGIQATEKRIGTSFDIVLKESDSIEASNRLVQETIDAGLCAKRFDGSVFMDLGADGRPVTLYRRNGTPTVHAQLIGVQVTLNLIRNWDKVIVLFGREWERGFETNCAIYRRMGFQWADRYEGVPHGMVTLSGAKMASRRGSVMRVDDILSGLVAYLMKVPALIVGVDFDRSPEVCELLALGFVKYFLLRCKRRADIDYSQEALLGPALDGFARIMQALVMADEMSHDPPMARRPSPRRSPIRALMLELNEVPRVFQKALEQRDPSFVLRLADQIADLFLRLRSDEVDGPTATAVAVVIRRCLEISGIQLPPGTVRSPGEGQTHGDLAGARFTEVASA